VSSKRVPAERQADEIFGYMAGKVKDCRRYRGTDHSIGRWENQVREAVILLSTHALLWTASDPKRLSRRAHQAIRNPRQGNGNRGRDHHSVGDRVAGASPAHPGRRERGIVCARDCGAGHSQAGDGGNRGSRLTAARTVSQRSPRLTERFDGHGRGHATGDRRCARIRRSKVLVTVW
jgi:hypothetical protein